MITITFFIATVCENLGMDCWIDCRNCICLKDHDSNGTNGTYIGETYHYNVYDKKGINLWHFSLSIQSFLALALHKCTLHIQIMPMLRALRRKKRTNTTSIEKY